ncbi:sugar transferase [uncultured Thiodictyon sp.]|jgi:lipopolysaccharide/colanic/teichoic acid biosynthesis glycosyltransferase|uniref:sugar transferase n=1 Tax=uncultured Thiodictyon sp. TaxID=1846217 RepID=UPI0025E24218|nr:sugar transferase [uncultured Thiodictyon sp.]
MNPKTDDRQLRELLIKRYAGIDRNAPRYLLKVYLKQIGWTAVVHGTRLVKRLLDIVVSSLLLVLLLPLFLLVALAISLESPGPVLLRQTRVGRWGKPFTLWTLRSTVFDPAKAGPDLPAAHSDAGTGVLRLTRIGTLMRTLGIDKLPHLANVLKGDMSLVGPPPALAQEVDRYSAADRCRLEIAPGIWQGASQPEVGIDRLVELDLQYSQSQSFLTDLKLLGMLTVLIFSGGGYSAAVSASPAAPPPNVFSYDNSRPTTVDIALAGGDGTPALLSFYSQGPNGLRLLENGFTDAQGSYYGEMRLPAHLTQVVVVVRTADREDTLTLAVSDQSIVYAE